MGNKQRVAAIENLEREKKEIDKAEDDFEEMYLKNDEEEFMKKITKTNFI